MKSPKRKTTTQTAGHKDSKRPKSAADLAVAQRLRRAVGDHMKDTAELLSWRAIAARAEMSEFVVYDIVTGRRRIQLDDIERLAPALNVRKCWLGFGQGPMREPSGATSVQTAEDLAALEALPELPLTPIPEAAPAASAREKSARALGGASRRRAR